jgi:hypothetical protein
LFTYHAQLDRQRQATILKAQAEEIERRQRYLAGMEEPPMEAAAEMPAIAAPPIASVAPVHVTMATSDSTTPLLQPASLTMYPPACSQPSALQQSGVGWNLQHPYSSQQMHLFPSGQQPLQQHFQQQQIPQHQLQWAVNPFIQQPPPPPPPPMPMGFVPSPPPSTFSQLPVPMPGGAQQSQPQPTTVSITSMPPTTPIRASGSALQQSTLPVGLTRAFSQLEQQQQQQPSSSRNKGKGKAVRKMPVLVPSASAKKKRAPPTTATKPRRPAALLAAREYLDLEAVEAAPGIETVSSGEEGSDEVREAAEAAEGLEGSQPQWEATDSSQVE